MNTFWRRMGRSGVYALLAMAFVLGCSLLLAEEEATAPVARWSDPTPPSSLTGSTDRHLPHESAAVGPGAGR